MTPPGRKYLIVNADDFGLSEGTNRGIVGAHEQGIVTSASLMVRHPAAAEAAAYARSHPSLGVGLHLDVGEWAYQGGRWVAVYQVVPPDDAGAVEAEVRRQLRAFCDLVGRAPTHLDSHQHAHRDGPLRGIAAGVAADLGVCLRHLDPRVAYRGDFYGQTGKGHPIPEAITAEALVRLVQSLPPGVTEMACHPGDDATLDSTYRLERLAEVASLCDPTVKSVLESENVTLVNFSQALIQPPRGGTE